MTARRRSGRACASRLAEQRLLVAALLRLREQLQGSLFVRYGSAARRAAPASTGRKHGPYYVLSTRSGGRGLLRLPRGRTARGARAHASWRATASSGAG